MGEEYKETEEQKVEEQNLSPQQYFDIVKDKKQHITDEDLKKVYDNSVVAVQDFNLEIADKEFIVLVGPSGCGKSTTLRMVAGLEAITEGEIYIGGRKVNNIPPM